jgi:NAD(P)-dependent dehydrogenase (short-subunit alcohol dehydrogenase family)
MQLENRIVVITGGTGDIGQAIGRRLASMGAEVTLLDVLSADAGEAIAAKLGPRIQYRKCDVTKRADVERVFAEFSRLDIVVPNAAIVRAGAFLKLSIEDWLETMNVNLTGAFHTAQVAARRMAGQPPAESGIRGRILFTGSWVQDMPYPGTFAYITSKGGLKMLARVMAQELATNRILVNLVAPGVVKAGLTKQLYDVNEKFRREILAAVPLEEFQSVESVAGAFAFLCTTDADYMTGATLLIDGGLSLVRYQESLE